MFAQIFACFLLLSLCKADTSIGKLLKELWKEPVNIYSANGHVVCLDKNKTISGFTANSFNAYFTSYKAIELKEWYAQSLTELEIELSDMLLVGITEFFEIGSTEQTRIRTRLAEKDFKLRAREADNDKNAKMANFFAFAARLLSMVEKNTAITDLNEADFAYALNQVGFRTLDPTQSIDLVGKNINLFFSLLYQQYTKDWIVRYYLAIPTSFFVCRDRAPGFDVPAFYEEPDLR